MEFEEQNSIRGHAGFSTTSALTDNRNAAVNDGYDEVDHATEHHNERDMIDVEAKLLGDKINNTEKSINGSKNGENSEYDRTLTEDINKLLRDMPLTEDTTCGFWIFKGKFFQKFANQTAYVILYGLVGSMFAMTYAYLNGTITTLEKRFKIPSKNIGIITVGYDISQVLVSIVLSCYSGKGHRPRWMGFGLLTIVLFCILTAVPHFLYGPGEDALALTSEFGAIADENATLNVVEETLCSSKKSECELDEGTLTPQIIFFTAHFISGIGGTLYYAFGISYMDDNTKKSKTPALLSLSYFLRMLGPAIGYVLASVCLRVYIAPQLHPVIDNKDPRWLGAWWIGWELLAGLLFVFGFFITLFPKDLPRAVARRMVQEERRKKLSTLEDNNQTKDGIELTVPTKVSDKEMLNTLKSLFMNKTLMCNNFSSVFYFFGYAPYWVFTPKYIEIQYRQSAATSSMVTGTVALVFSAVGVLLSGFVISRYKPRARYMAAWNVIVGFLTVFGILGYAFIGCPGNEQSVIVNIHDRSLNETTCNSACHCDYVRYSPVCGENGMTYISPCHAGCKQQHVNSNGQKIFYDCSCIPQVNASTTATPSFERLTALDFEAMELTFDESNMRSSTTSSRPVSSSQRPDGLSTFLKGYQEKLTGDGGQAIADACAVDCFTNFVTFLFVMCCLKFFGAAGRASNFLVSVRCVPEKDKVASMGINMVMMSLMAFIPSPIFFGWILDRLCLVWGKTCTNKGNCWLYDPESLRYILNITAAGFILIGTLFDCGVWYLVKELKIFDEEVKEVEMKIAEHEKEAKDEANCAYMEGNAY